MTIPWQFLEEVSDDEQRTLYRLIYIAGFLSIVTFFSQLIQPAPYGRHDPKDDKWGPPVNQRLGHVLNDGLWGVVFFFIIYFGFYGHIGMVNLIFVVGWLCHFIHRGFIHPFVMRYSSSTISLGIPLTGLTLAYFSYLHATFFAKVHYRNSYLWDIRFVLGAALFVLGFILNRLSDWKLKNLRKKPGVYKYYIPNGGLFEYVTCPNYLGEMIEWLGWAIATWSFIGLVYFVFASATFIPRSQHNHQWYLMNFRNYPEKRKALIPYIY